MCKISLFFPHLHCCSHIWYRFAQKLLYTISNLGSSDGKETACNAGNLGLILESGRSPSKGNGNPLQYSCLENSMHREAWWVHEVAKSWTWMSDYHLKRPWCWERLRVGGEGDDRGWDGWRASPTQQTWVWVDSGSWWWTGRPGVMQYMGSQRVRYDWQSELNWTEQEFVCIAFFVK